MNSVQRWEKKHDVKKPVVFKVYGAATDVFLLGIFPTHSVSDLKRFILLIKFKF